MISAWASQLVATVTVPVVSDAMAGAAHLVFLRLPDRGGRCALLARQPVAVMTTAEVVPLVAGHPAVGHLALSA